MSYPDYSSQGWQNITVSLDSPVAIVKLNRAKQRNTFTNGLEQDLVAAYELLDLDDRVHVIILTADHTAPAYCSGAELNSGWGSIYSKEDELHGRHTHRDAGGKVTLAIFRCRKITIAAVNGHAVGVGITGLQLPCDFRFVWAGAKLALPFVRRGIAAEAASGYLLPRLLGYSRAVALLLTGGTYSPDSPLLQGLYYATFPNREDVLPAALAFSHELAANTSQTSIAWSKALLWRGADSIEGQHILDSRGIADLVSRGDAAEGAKAFKERRSVKFTDKVSKDLSDFVPWWTELDVRQRKTKL
ncbi:peroxisomal enoyl-CoA-hydratase [Multifurca ochricompacta]|uniref:Peroxisomal enoyl-CoA-hydratase n=1 Tax=Multifurca ochricompacta TaxID=376703 RepID=A0AAD4M7T7_9AGAM|nr:peroxisomal enoyl-CoA-hydratase [Multifurca ochricompacta]